MEHIVFLTGRLAQLSLHQVLESIAPAAVGSPFTWEIREIGLQVAGLMTADMIRRRVETPLSERTSRMIVPGRCRGDLDALTAHYGVTVERGPEEVKDLPQFFGREARHMDLSRYETEIFAEIVDAPRLDLDGIAARAREYKRQGADVIDVGCLPETPFPHLEDAVAMLKEQGYRVSVDSMRDEELVRGGRAGADYVMSLNADTLWIADEIASTPILVPREPADVASLDAAIEAITKRGRPFLADPILDPIPFGLAASIARYVSLRERYPDVPIMMGVGNVTELTEADTSGINAVLFGMAAELRIAAVLTTSVSLHARRAVREADVARRVMHAARETQTLPKGISADLSALHAKRPFPYDADEIATLAAAIRDPNFRVQVSADGIHVYNRDGHHVAVDPFALYPELKVESDGGHAFYLGVQLARAEIAWQLGKRFDQDQPLDWGCEVDRPDEDLMAWHAPGSTKKKS
ncbi:dihydropteroate synthase [Caballeronia novacaledonica]|uniref:Dihydropteroate synthase n=1 Tax=Caballeronia novacaledonica TaxID=1544861 RepID=A0ACB5QQM2_9BURK|nr:dihydropteroate synthase [Caballeronia novacaledonica]